LPGGGISGDTRLWRGRGRAPLLLPKKGDGDGGITAELKELTATAHHGLSCWLPHQHRTRKEALVCRRRRHPPAWSQPCVTRPAEKYRPLSPFFLSGTAAA
ncbi:unnamed protein product, partial [Ectocarpus fasciculatus]